MTHPTSTTLLAVTGLAPQVITETLYGIAQSQLDWPHKIVIITTKKGKQAAIKGLLTPRPDGTPGQLKQLCDELGKPPVYLTEDNILAVSDADKQAMDDTRSEADQQALANFIVKEVAKLCSDPDTRLHTSIAGGRKTMTFYLGYAMSIFGRPFDRLSHVLVSEQYEYLPDFYFPTSASKLIENRNGEQFDCRDAQVTLSEIPFVSLRSLFSPAQIQLFNDMDYADLVAQVQLATNPDSINLTLYAHFNDACLMINDFKVDFSDNLMEYVFLLMCAHQGEQSEIKRPSAVNIKADPELPQKLADNFLKALALFVTDTDYRDSMSPANKVNALTQNDAVCKKFTHKTLNDLVNKGMTLSMFDSRRNDLKTILQRQLPMTLVNIILPHPNTDSGGETSEKRTQGSFYRIPLHHYRIRIETKARY
ncbi:CRISPR-associated ring nuclease Csm6 [Pseudoalteromonas sp. R3]|uniref:CRISPR-associated ring nuclease Csm6 n=1 Tax=Pseudoalteromonas sp. R3 TaxID=1709477 RepID=UPI0006B4D5D8|nr:CRISPR-associated ring nuclease Csm6 [Pseudoalteromonas sp. R3]